MRLNFSIVFYFFLISPILLPRLCHLLLLFAFLYKCCVGVASGMSVYAWKSDTCWNLEVFNSRKWTQMPVRKKVYCIYIRQRDSVMIVYKSVFCGQINPFPPIVPPSPVFNCPQYSDQFWAVTPVFELQQEGEWSSGTVTILQLLHCSPSLTAACDVNSTAVEKVTPGNDTFIWRDFDLLVGRTSCGPALKHLWGGQFRGVGQGWGGW